MESVTVHLNFGVNYNHFDDNDFTELEQVMKIQPVREITVWDTGDRTVEIQIDGGKSIKSRITLEPMRISLFHRIHVRKINSDFVLVEFFYDRVKSNDSI